MVLAASLYALSTIVFGIMAIVIGFRLIWLSRVTKTSAEWHLGLGIMCTAGLGYMVQMLSAMLTILPEQVATAMRLFGSFSFCVGVTCVLHFTIEVFRTGQAWAKALGLAMTVTLWAGWISNSIRGPSAEPDLMFWGHMAITCAYPVWMGTESLVYFGRMRRQLALGLSDPVVTNRFLLWGLASFTTAASVWSVASVAIGRAGTEFDITSMHVQVALLVTAAFGLGTIGLYWLTFFPPAWYSARIGSNTSLEEAA